MFGLTKLWKIRQTKGLTMYNTIYVSCLNLNYELVVHIRNNMQSHAYLKPYFPKRQLDAMSRTKLLVLTKVTQKCE